MGGQGRMRPTPKHCSSAGTSQGVGIPIGDPLHIAADTLWLSGRNAVAFTEGLGDFGFEKCASRKKEKSDCSGKKKKRKKEGNKSPRRFPVVLFSATAGTKVAAGWQPACDCLLCSQGHGPRARSFEEFPVWGMGGGRQPQKKDLGHGHLLTKKKLL